MRYFERTASKKFFVIACNVMMRELCLYASQSSAIIDFAFLPQGLHNDGKVAMKTAIQAEIDKIDSKDYDAILLGYGLCSNGVEGLSAKIPMVIPRAHDCITLFLGSKEKYDEVFKSSPGTYYCSSGWLERAQSDDSETSVISKMGLGKSKDEYAEEYGEELAELLGGMLDGWTDSYTDVHFINTGTGDVEAIRELAMKNASDRELKYSESEGDTILIKKLLSGEWDEESFQLILPENTISASWDRFVVKSIPKC